MEETIMMPKKLRILFVIMIVSFGVTGWAYASKCVNLLNNGKLKLEVVPSKGYYISKVHVNQVNDGIEITGAVKRRSYAGKGGGHVDIAIISPEGDVLNELSTFYLPRMIHMKRIHTRESGFEVYMPMIPPKGSKVRVALHRLSKSASKEFSCEEK
jgi:hypothetical protein